VIIFAENFASVGDLKATIAKLQAAARRGGQPPLLIATDQEGGVVKRLPAAPPFESAAGMGADGSASRAKQAGVATGAALRSAGINIDLAPVLDVPSSSTSFLGSRAFGQDPARVRRVGVAFGSGLQTGGVAATAKHFPGLGAAAANTDLGDVTIFSSQAELRRNLTPFAAAVRSGMKLVMVSNARYPALDPSRRPAVLSKPIVTGLLRGRLGFQGVTITDTLAAPSVRAYTHVPLRSIRAGIDVLLYSDHEKDSADAYAQLRQAVRSGRLHRATLQQSLDRIIALKSWLARRR
jgi:beta-N-acetylhexosaminidase